jgi:GntR family transcriptional regulator, transcriptional repressor for pyruvate dehydrogenase complex
MPPERGAMWIDAADAAAPGELEGRPRKDAVIERVLELVRTGRLAVDDRLPPEGDLAASFAVSRTVVREAMKALEAVGVVRIEQGRGTFVTANPLSRPFSLWATMNLYRFDEMYEVRKIVESETASRAALLVTPNDLTAMRQAIAQYQEAWHAHDWPRLVAADCGFHLAIARACGLGLLAEMLEVTVPVWTNVSPHTDYDRAAASGAEHDRILAAIEARDARRARLAMVDHVDAAYRRLHAAAEAAKGGDRHR